MSLYKRITALLAAMLIVFMNTAAGAKSFTDVNDTTQYKNDIITLTTIGLINGYADGTFRSENNITRGEFTSIMVRALAMEDHQKSEPTGLFTDIDGHFARFNIKTAYEMGIINGFDDGTFRPDDNVTYEQAVKMVVCTLGYTESAVAYGGYPAGYLNIAGQLGLTSGITALNGEPATRGVIVRLVNNALNVTMQKPVLNYDGTYRYIATDETLLKTYLKIERIKVLVTGVGSFVIEGSDSDLKSYEMRAENMSGNKTLILDFSALYKDHNEPRKYLGHTIYVFYKDLDDDEFYNDELIAIDDQTEKSSEVMLISRQIEEYDDVNHTLEYKPEGSDKTKTVKLNAETVTVSYNGKIAAPTEKVELKTDTFTMKKAISHLLDPDDENFLNGEIKLVDSEDDGEIDVVFITNYKAMVANAVPSSTDYRLTNKLVTGDSLILDPDDDNYKITIERNGSSVAAATGIRANDVVLYAQSTDGEYITVNVTAKPVTGEIAEIDSEEDTITVSGKVYYISEDCRKYVEDAEKLKVGAQGTFYIDCYDNIYYLTISSTSAAMSYGYIINSSDNVENGTNNITIYAPKESATGTSKFTLASKVHINGTSKGSDYIADALEKTSEYSREDIDMADKVYANSNTSPSAGRYAQVVKYALKKKEITDIITLEDEGGTGETNIESDVLVRYKPLAKYTYSATNNFSNEFYINSSTVIMYVPASRSTKGDYQKYAASSIFKTNQSYWVEPYDVNESKVASLVLVYGNSSLADITKDTVMSVVAKTPTLVDVSDDTVNKLTLYNSKTALVTKNSDDDVEFADVEPGDVIQYGQSNNGRIINRKNIISAQDVKDVLDSGKFDWTDSKFDIKFINDEGEIEWDSVSDTAYSRAFVANVVEAKIDDEDRYIRVTRDGFDDDGNISSDNEERYSVDANVPIIRFSTSKDTLSAYVGGTTTKLTIEDLSGAKTSGSDCSKVFIYTLKGEIKFMMIYE